MSVAMHGGGLARRGRELAKATAAMVLLHGRGGSAADILSLEQEIEEDGFTFVAPQATDHTWYPLSFLAPLADNEPALSTSLTVVDQTLGHLESNGIAPERTILLGFSQGACLALEYAVRHPRRFGGVVGLTGGLIGPPGTVWQKRGSLVGTPVFLGAGDPDPHVPWERVEETATVLGRLGAEVTLRRYRGMPHSINGDELAEVRRMMRELQDVSTAQEQGS